MSITLQISRMAPGAVPGRSAVLFDTIDSVSGAVSYSALTGLITIRENGSYSIFWWVASQSALGTEGVVFQLAPSEGRVQTGNSPSKAGEICGMGILDITAAPVTLNLANASSGPVFFASSVPVKAALTVRQIDAAGPAGPTGPTGPPGPPGTPADSMACFCLRQLAHVIRQLILYYPTSIFTVYTDTLNYVTGRPHGLYPPDEGREALFLLNDGAYGALPLHAITAICMGEGTVYNPLITYLPLPAPLPPGCDTDLVLAVHNYLPASPREVTLYLPVVTTASGAVYRSEYGILVLSDGEGNAPVFIPTGKISIAETSMADSSRTTGRPKVEISPGKNRPAG